MKKSRAFWNYLDMVTKTILVFTLIIVTYLVCESLERYFYRYTLFPFIAVILIFLLGIMLGIDIEKTKKKKPVGLISKKMAKVRKRKNIFIFQDQGQTYVPHKEIIEDIKSGEIVHVKQLNDNNFEPEDFYEVYKVEIDNLVDDKMDEKSNEESK